MALIICPECNSAISEHADRCPTCGCSGETLRRLMKEKKDSYQEYREKLEEGILSRAEYEWGCYVNALSEAAEKYNNEFKKIEERYASNEKQLIEYAQKAQNTAAEANERIKDLSAKNKQVGLFSIKKRNQLQGEIDKELLRCENLKSEIHNSVNDLKNKRNSEIDVIAEQLKKVEDEQAKRIEDEVDDLTVRDCTSSKDVVLTIIRDKYFQAYHIREMLEILGIMTKDDIRKNLAFTGTEEFDFLTHYTYKLDEILDDSEFCETIGIGQKQVLDDYYYIALSDSAKDKIRQDRVRAFDNRMKYLRQRIRELDEQNEQMTMSSYNKNISGQANRQTQASVLKRGALGAVIAGPAGAIIGVGSALNKNLTNK